MKIAVIGSGISGLAVAHALSGRHEITIYEKQKRIGGHSYTVEVSHYGPTFAVDVGFIIYNRTTYPNLTRLFRELGVRGKPTQMSFSVSLNDGGFEWGTSGPSMIFAQRKNLFKPRFYGLLFEILRFFRVAKADLARGAVGDGSIRDYLRRHRFSDSIATFFLVPMGASIWSASSNEFLEHPAQVLLTFLEDHKLLGLKQPIWLTFPGGARTYVDKLAVSLEANIRLGVGAVGVRRGPEGVIISDTDSKETVFDHVVLACHAPDSLRILQDAMQQETEILGAFKYSSNEIFLHGDSVVMPRRRAAWASWNFAGSSSAERADDVVNVTYWMNQLQHIDAKYPVFVTLNPRAPLKKELVFSKFVFEHPQFDTAALNAQKNLHAIQGIGNVWFCGAYCGHGFHEDGMRSGLEIASKIDPEAPISLLGRPRIFA